jgi:hypothetical protein
MRRPGKSGICRRRDIDRAQSVISKLPLLWEQPIFWVRPFDRIVEAVYLGHQRANCGSNHRSRFTNLFGIIVDEGIWALCHAAEIGRA